MSDVLLAATPPASASASATATAAAAGSGARSTSAAARGARDDRDFGSVLKSTGEGAPATAAAKADKPVAPTPGDEALHADEDDAAAAATATPAAADSASLAGMIQTLLAAAATQARPPAETRAAGTTAAPRATVASTALPTTLATTAAVLPASGTAPSAAPESPEPASLADPKKPLTGLPGTATKAEHGETPTAGLSATLSAALSAAVGVAGIEPGTQPADAAASMLQAAAATRETTATPVPPTAASAPAAPAQSPTLDVAQLPQQLGERLRWLIDGSVQEARLSLHPQELGNIDVRIRVEDGSAKVWFAAEHPAARAALDAALPQLRERFAGDGLNLQSSAVSTQGRGWDSQGQSQSSSRFSGGTAPAIDDSAETTVDSPAASSRSAVHEGLIDRYA